MTEHATAHKKHTHAHACTKGHLVVVVVNFFVFFFFFPIHITKGKGQGLVELMKELTNITKILQFVNISSTLSAFMNRGGDPGCVGRVGGEGEGSAGPME